jgi:hypothetical protein
MKRITYIFLSLSILLFIACSCNGYLDVEPKDRITGSALLSSDAGIESYMAAQYFNIPMEDFRYDFTKGGSSAFNICRTDGGKNNMMSGPEATHSEWGDHIGETGRYNDWEALYKDIRSFNELKDNIELMQPSDPSTIDQITGEYYFMMAYAYFALAKRYGGVPIIRSTQEWNGDYDEVKVPRSTEVETWKFVLEMCDQAINYLPDNTDQRRANKWTAYALKSRAALFAASVGKFWDRDGAALTGEAVDQKLVGGFTQEDIDFFYQECINASAEVIKSGKFSLNGGTEPASLEEAAENYRQIFINGKGMSEVIFLRDYTYPGIAHNFGKWHEPNQLSTEYGGRCDPTLDLVDSYAVIDEQGAAHYEVPLTTTTDGNEDYAQSGFNSSVNYKLYDNMSDIFADRDPRLYASVILPNTEWGNETIIIQGGIRRQDGSVIWQANDSYEFNGVTYYGKGNSDDVGSVSGWVSNRSNGTRTGFLIKKYLQGPDYDQTWDQVTTPFVDLRYGEVLMNYAEAVAESGLSSASGTITAEEALNMVHHRAGFKDDIPCTPQYVRYERRSEMALDYSSVWDYWRRRELHTFFDNVRQRHGLVPMLDFTSGEQKYIFVRANIEVGNSARHFEEKGYYRPIPGIENNSLVQNPNY